MDSKHLNEAIRPYVPEPSDEQIGRFHLYIELLAKECERQNLSKYRTPQDILTYHILDSLEPLHHAPCSGQNKCIDIGTGAGCPGIPLAIAAPHIRMTLLEARERRCDFLRRCVECLRLENCDVLQGRAESWAYDSQRRGAYDHAYARAVIGLQGLVEIALPFLKPGGVLCAFRGHRWKEEQAESANALAELCGKIKDAFVYHLPGRDTEHALVLIENTRPSPETYPRSPKQIQKKPL